MNSRWNNTERIDRFTTPISPNFISGSIVEVKCMSDFEALKRAIITNLTSTSKEKPLPEKILAKRLDVNDRYIREAIVSLIEDKHLILSSPKGLWIENDPRVVLEYCEKIYSTGMAYMKKQSDLKHAVEVKFGQLSMRL